MQTKKQYNIIAPAGGSIEAFENEKTLRPFDESVLKFIESFSTLILSSKKLKVFPDIVSLAFWFRKVNVLNLKKEYFNGSEKFFLAPRGIVFQITPSNVDTIFIYSWFLSFLAGNLNIIRISNKTDEQVEATLDLINTLVSKDEFKQIRKKFILVRYNYDDEITKRFSLMCDMRVIWGGNETINKIRAVTLRPDAHEITFANRFSYSLIKASAFLQLKDRREAVRNFYTDAYWFGQNACSSPRLVVWVGTAKEIYEAKEILWSSVESLIKQRGEPADNYLAVKKLQAEYSLALDSENEVRVDNGLIDKIHFSSFKDIARYRHCGGGLFYEVGIKKIDELAKFALKEDQTVSVFGFSQVELVGFMGRNGVRGIDRFTRFGDVHKFSPVWDGYDLLKELSRKVEIF